MNENKDFLMDEPCDCDDECMKLSLDDATDEDLDRLWDEADDDEFDICASEKARKRRNCIIAGIVAGAVITILIVAIYKICKKSKKD